MIQCNMHMIQRDEKISKCPAILRSTIRQGTEGPLNSWLVPILGTSSGSQALNSVGEISKEITSQD